MDSENIRSKFVTDKSGGSKSEDKSSLSEIAMSYYKKFAHDRDIKQYFIISSTLNSSDELAEKNVGKPTCPCKVSPSKLSLSPDAPIVKERKKWARPPLSGQENLYLSDNPDGVLEESFDTGRMSPASSIASYKRLEWDSGADVGYQNASIQKQQNLSISLPVLNSLEKLTLNQNHPLSDPGESNLHNPIHYETSSLERSKKRYSVAQSTPLPTIKSSFFEGINIQLTPVISDVNTDFPHQQISELKLKINKVTSQEQAVNNAEASMENVQSKDKNPIPQLSSDSVFKVPQSHQMVQTTLQKTTSKSIQTPSTSQTPEEQHWFTPEYLTTTSYEQLEANLYPNTCNFDSVNLPKSNSFEYLPGDSYEQRTNSDNYPSISPDNCNNSSPNDSSPKGVTCPKHSSACSCKSYGSSQDSIFISSQLSSSLTEDLKQSALVLRRMIESKKCTPKEKKKLIKIIVKKIVETHYDEDDEVSGSSKSTKTKENVTWIKVSRKRNSSHTSESCNSERETQSNSTVESQKKDKAKKKHFHKTTSSNPKKSSDSSSDESILQAIYNKLGLHETEKGVLEKVATKSDETSREKEENLLKSQSSTSSNTKTVTRSDFDLHLEKASEEKSKSSLVSEFSKSESCLPSADNNWKDNVTLSEKLFDARAQYLKVQNDLLKIQREDKSLNTSDSLLPTFKLSDKILSEISEKDYQKNLSVIEAEIAQLTHLKNLLEQKKRMEKTTPDNTVHEIKSNSEPSKNLDEKSTKQADHRRSQIIFHDVLNESFTSKHFDNISQNSITSKAANAISNSKDSIFSLQSQNSTSASASTLPKPSSSVEKEHLQFLKKNRFIYDKKSPQKEKYEFEGTFNQEITDKIVQNLMHLKENPEEFQDAERKLDGRPSSSTSLATKKSPPILQPRKIPIVEELAEEPNITWDSLLKKVLATRTRNSMGHVFSSPSFSVKQPVNLEALNKAQTIDWSNIAVGSIDNMPQNETENQREEIFKSNFSTQTPPLVQNQGTETVDFNYMQDESTQTHCVCQNFMDSSPRISRVLKENSLPNRQSFVNEKFADLSSSKRRSNPCSSACQSTPRSSYATPNTQSTQSSPTVLSNISQSTQTTDNYSNDKLSDNSYQCDCNCEKRYIEQEYLRQRIKDDILKCECCKLKRMQRKKNRHKFESKTTNFCTCHLYNRRHRNHVHEIIHCPHCSRCQCVCKCQNVPKSSRKPRERQPGVSYFLRLESNEDIVEENEVTGRRQSVQEVKIYVPKKGASSSQRSGSIKADSVPFEPLNQEESKIIPPPLQDYLEKNRPDFIQAADVRRKMLTEAALERHQRSEQRKQLLLMMADSNKVSDLAKNLKNIEIPKQQPYRRRPFSYRKMREITNRHYRELPEVKQKIKERRLQQQARANRLMMHLFNKKLQNYVHRGHVSLSYSISVLSTI